jgi:PIN domain nuclease of toxin-antitoxin system
MLWAVDDPAKLSGPAASILRNKANEILVSAATIWELAIKSGQGKLKLSTAFRPWMTQAIADLGASILPITIEYADVQASMPRHHGDPFDRLLVAQAMVEAVPIVSGDVVLDQYGITRYW